jgi:hypothetical protein
MAATRSGGIRRTILSRPPLLDRRALIGYVLIIGFATSVSVIAHTPFALVEPDRRAEICGSRARTGCRSWFLPASHPDRLCVRRRWP